MTTPTEQAIEKVRRQLANESERIVLFPDEAEPLLSHIAQLTREKEALVKALDRHGRHDTYCDQFLDKPCSCGFDAALAKHQPEETK